MASCELLALIGFGIWLQLDATLPPLKNFILPGGGLASAHLHVARTLARRVERRIIPIVERGDADEVVIKYCNR